MQCRTTCQSLLAASLTSTSLLIRNDTGYRARVAAIVSLMTSGQSDRFLSMFGFVPPWLPSAVGAIVMTAAVLESKIDSLLMNLDVAPQPTFAGSPAKANLERCRKRLEAAQPSNRQFAERTLALLDRVQAALEDRNAVVHSLWPASSQQVARGWRNLPPNQRESPVDDGVEPSWSRWTEMNEIAFEDLGNRLYGLVAEMADAVAAAGAWPQRNGQTSNP